MVGFKVGQYLLEERCWPPVLNPAWLGAEIPSCCTLAPRWRRSCRQVAWAAAEKKREEKEQ